MATDAELAAQLRAADLRILGRMVDASNLALLCELEGRSDIRCIYKPVQGERPLWDFPDVALAHREVAMFHLTEALLPGRVPITVWRDEGPLGPGMCQLFIEDAQPSDAIAIIDGHETPDGWITILHAHDSGGAPVSLVHRDDPMLRRIALLDAIANNADRKGGHLLEDPAGRLYVIDHGVTFHVEPKLRTVLWGWAGQDLLPDELALLDQLLETWSAAFLPHLSGHLSTAEIEATWQRASSLREGRTMPVPSAEWPSLPWPVL